MCHIYNHSPWVHKNEPQYHYKCCLYIVVHHSYFRFLFYFLFGYILYVHTPHTIHQKIYLSLSTRVHIIRDTHIFLSVCFFSNNKRFGTYIIGEFFQCPYIWKVFHIARMCAPLNHMHHGSGRICGVTIPVLLHLTFYRKISTANI